ncbi:hypothetical protein ACFUJY_18065 [Streptomyces sp. NPDC057249]|uniref:hypothetical protein n=1 Tax=Streptomyces sp. NPDC057249 TaxID=3346067 RepID=UPI00362A1597
MIEQAIATGRLVTNSGGGAAAYVTREDCAAAAAVLTRDGYENRTLDITGPAALTARDLAELACEIGGRDVELVDVDDHAFATRLEEVGLPDPVSELLTSFGASTRGGFLAHVSSAVGDLTGREPTSLADAVRATPKS